MVAIGIGIVSFLIPHSYNFVINDETINSTVHFPTHFSDNLYPKYTTESVANNNPCHGTCNFQVVFSIICLHIFSSSFLSLTDAFAFIVPMVTGIMEVRASLSKLVIETLP
jgi:hypothetical protein